MKTLVFAVAGYNLAETGRMIEIAREARRDFNIVFASYGGQFEELIKKEGFSLIELQPRLTREQLERLRIVLSGETLNTVGYVQSHIKNMTIDIPDNVVVTGFLPAHKVNPMADISVIHGGQNTVMNACLAGTPIVGIGMHPRATSEFGRLRSKGVRYPSEQETCNSI